MISGLRSFMFELTGTKEPYAVALGSSQFLSGNRHTYISPETLNFFFFCHEICLLHCAFPVGIFLSALAAAVKRHMLPIYLPTTWYSIPRSSLSPPTATTETLANLIQLDNETDVDFGHDTASYFLYLASYKYCCRGLYCPDCHLTIIFEALGKSYMVHRSLGMTCGDHVFNVTVEAVVQPGIHLMQVSGYLYNFICSYILWRG